MATPRYSVKLEPRVLTKARKILGFLLLFFAVFTIAGIHQGVVSGDFDKVFIQPFRQFAADLEKTTEPAPILMPLTSIAPLPTSTPSPVKKTAPVTQPVVKQTQPVVSNCIRKNIREGEFASNKCYSSQDYDDLMYYISRYNSSVFEKDTQESFIKVTCPGMSEMFQKSCEEHKQQKAAAESDINKYRGIVQGIIAKGQ